MSKSSRKPKPRPRETRKPGDIKCPYCGSKEFFDAGQRLRVCKSCYEEY